MAAGTPQPTLAFVWRLEDLQRGVMDLERQAAAGVIFDLTQADPAAAASLLQEARAREARLFAHQLLPPRFKEFVRTSGITCLWVECHRALTPVSPEELTARFKELGSHVEVIPVTGDLDFIRLLSRTPEPPRMLALKGSEAAGFVSGETLNILWSSVKGIFREAGAAPRLAVWGGVATPEAAAAYLAGGAARIVFESLHWLTHLTGLDDTRRQRLTRLRPDATALVGANLGTPVRLFNRGNSLAVRELAKQAATLSQGRADEQERRDFARLVLAHAKHPLNSSFGRDEVIPLSPEAAFAAAFVQRYGQDTAAALKAFGEEVRRCWNGAEQVREAYLDTPVARELGVAYPFIQGAMTWITDLPRFARAVADAGGLPTLALGLRRWPQLEQDLGNLKELMDGRPYAVNLIALPENPALEDQLAWIARHRPPFAVIAAGDPAYAGRLLEQGVEVFYLAPDVGLLRLALEAGVRYVVLEGHEAGGHVGVHSTLTLAQIALDLKRREPELCKNCRIILAGGIFDRETAFRAAMLGADAIQMGTAYLATREIVDTGALSPLYQRLILQAAPGDTAVSGEAVGLRVRSLKTPKMGAILTLEEEFASGREDEAAFRQRLEALTARSLLVAARGVDRPGGPALDEPACLKEGQFMSGAAAGSLAEVRTLAELHRELAQGPLAISLPAQELVEAPAVVRTAAAGNGSERLAITGMALVNALGNSPEEIWEACLALKTGITEVPLSRWDHSRFFDPDPRASEKTYCKAGAFQHLTLSRKELGIAPHEFRTMAESTKLTMWLAQQALRDAGILSADIPKERIGVVISQNSGESASTLRGLVLSMSARFIVEALEGLLPLSPALAAAAEEQIKSQGLRVDDTTLLGRLNCTAGGFICNRYGFMGPSFSVSAACATSLVALYSAVQMVRNGVLDAALVGGGEELLSPAHFLEFSALKALAGVSGADRPAAEMSRPFDALRDGMVLGEGGGMIVIERESVARRRGARIHAFITGIGASNNDRGMVESVAETQEIAIRAAFENLPYGPGAVDLVECHATATMQGDVEEVQALKHFFPKGRRTFLSSFKSQIGHTLGASGLNSLVRGVMAMNDGIIPPTLNYQVPDPNIDLESWGFEAPREPADWPRQNGLPRRTMVNAFGFGGANYVVHLEECRDHQAPVFVSVPVPSLFPAEPAAAPKARAEVQGVSCCRANIAGQALRLGVVAGSEDEARAKIAALPPLEAPLTPKVLRSLERQGVLAGLEGEPPPPLALVFAGQGTYYPGMGKELYENFPVIREWMDKIAQVADFDILDLLFHSRDERLKQTLWQQPALFTMEYAMVQYLLSLGVRPVAMAGHSLGELLALCVAGVFSYEDGFHIVHKRAQCMDQAGILSQDPGIMVAVNVPMDVLGEKVAARERVYFTNFNSPRQVVLGGATQDMLALKAELDAEGYWTYQLRVSMAFHSPIMAVIRDEMQAFIDTLEFHPPRIPVISNTTMQPFPDDPAEIKRIVMAHLESPVHWTQNVQSLWNDFGVRFFLEVGPKDTMCNLVQETLEAARVAPTCDPEGEALTYRTALARLYALGHLTPPRPPLTVVLPGAAPAAAPAPARPTPLPAGDRVAAVVQREINAFVLESFGKFLKPAIVEAVRREADPFFDEARLEALLGGGVAAPVAPAARPAIPAPAAPAAAPVAPSPPARPAPVPSPAPEGDYLEQVIGIIIDATGYERDEIEPDMDLRQDLAIRSSRLPVIIDAAERQFGITVRIEDFIDVRTVRGLADRIAEVVARDGAAPDSAAPVSPGKPLAQPLEPVAASAPEAGQPRPALKRLVFREFPLEEAAPRPLVLPAGQDVAVLNLGADPQFARQVADFCERTWKAAVLSLNVSGQEADLNLTTPDGAAAVAARLDACPNLAGLILVMEDGAPPPELDAVPALLTGLFQCLQALTRSSAKEFALLADRGLTPESPWQVAAQGVLGMFLAAAQEYGSVLFRTAALDRATPPAAALAQALDRRSPILERLYRQGQAYALEARSEDLPLPEAPVLDLKPGHVVVISGGGRGITAHLARALAPFAPRLALLGRSPLPSPEDADQLLAAKGPANEAARRLLLERQPDLKGARLDQEISHLVAGLEVDRTLQDLRLLGLEAAYYRVDVADRAAVDRVLDQVAADFGRIDGVIHGAGLLRDSFMKFMTPDDFHRVVQVKLTGALNLHRAARGRGLRFMAALSSAAAVQGNIGQVNYCAANRALGAFLQALGPGLLAKTLVLPPIEGTGMADDPEVKELLKMKGLADAYVRVEELAECFCRELFLGPPQDRTVMLARALPEVPATRIDLSPPPAPPDRLSAGAVSFSANSLPMLDEVERLDLHAGEALATRRFSPVRDLWLPDHRPFKFLKHPPVSGIMAIETFLEAAHVLYPHLTLLGVRQVEYQDLLACPVDLERDARILCRRHQLRAGETVCQVSLSSPDLSPAGRQLDRWSTNFEGQVVLGSSLRPLKDLQGFPVGPQDLETRPAAHEEVLQWYGQKTDLTGRYRVMDSLEGTSHGLVRGRAVYRESDDFAGRQNVRYLFSPYLFEAMMHLVTFYVVMRDSDEPRVMIPRRVAELRWTRPCRDGEALTLEARLRVQDEQGNTWDVQARDADGHILMQAQGLTMKWFSE